MSKKRKNRAGAEEEQNSGQDRETQSPPLIEPKFYTWAFYGKVYAGCFAVSLALFLIFVGIMKAASQYHLDEAIAMYEVGKSMKESDTTANVEETLQSITGIDAMIDVEEMRMYLVSDILLSQSLSDEMKRRLKFYIDQFSGLKEALQKLDMANPLHEKVLKEKMKTIDNVNNMLREALERGDQPDRQAFQEWLTEISWKLDDLHWDLQQAGGFLNWPTAFDAAENSIYESQRYWRENPEAHYYWGLILDELGIKEVAAEKKVMAIKYDPGSDRSAQLLDEFRQKYESDSSAMNKYYYAFALYRMERADEAVTLYQEIVSADPQAHTWFGYLANRRLRIIREKIDTTWSKTDDF